MKTVRVFSPEQRICRECGESFFANKPSWKCRKCYNKHAKRKAQELRGMGMARWTPKDPYPLEDAKKKTKFSGIRSKLNKMHFRHEWKEYISERLDSVLNDEPLMKWIFDRRDKQSIEESKTKKYGIDTKGYPSTKNVNLDEY